MKEYSASCSSVSSVSSVPSMSPCAISVSVLGGQESLPPHPAITADQPPTHLYPCTTTDISGRRRLCGAMTKRPDPRRGTHQMPSLFPPFRLTGPSPRHPPLGRSGTPSPPLPTFPLFSSSLPPCTKLRCFSSLPRREDVYGPAHVGAPGAAGTEPGVTRSRGQGRTGV